MSDCEPNLRCQPDLRCCQPDLRCQPHLPRTLSDTVLLLLLQRMGDKESPFTYVETHAGAGSYDLLEGAAAKLNEQADGIELLLNFADRAGGLDECE